MTIGEQRVRMNFNPSADTAVEDIKRRAADCIDWCHSRFEASTDAEVRRLYALAMTDFEAAAMWAVKAATAGK